MQPVIYICYRRSDSALYALALSATLKDRFGNDSVFLDVEKIGGVHTWKQQLDEHLSRSMVVLVLIGPKWVSDFKKHATCSAAEKNDGKLPEEPEDWVKSEIKGALDKKTHIIPIVVGGASRLPKPSQIPADVRRVLDYQAIRVREEAWQRDVDALVAAIEKHGISLRIDASTVQPPVMAQRGTVFQSFPKKGGAHLNVVHYLFADPYKSGSAWIKAFVLSKREELSLDADNNMLRVQFDNGKSDFENDKVGGFPCNVGIMSVNSVPLERISREYRYLALDARAVPMSGTPDDRRRVRVESPQIQIAVRLHDRYRRSFMHFYRKGDGYVQLLLPKSGTWQTFYLDLDNPDLWSAFFRGWGAITPDFSVIQELVLELGEPHDHRPCTGSGTVDIANIRLEKHETKPDIVGNAKSRRPKAKRTVRKKA